jgi:hypothetical protein
MGNLIYFCSEKNITFDKQTINLEKLIRCYIWSIALYDSET